MQLATGAVRRITGASQRQLSYWDSTGLLKPRGKGTGHRRYTFPDVVAIKTVMALRRQGCSLQQIRKAVEHLRSRYPHNATPDVLASLTLLTDGKTVYMLTDTRQVMDVMSKQTVWWIVNVGKLIREAQEAMQTLPVEWVEPVNVRREVYRLRVTHDADEGGYVVQCVELPGAIEQGETPDEAIENGKAAIGSVLAFLEKRAGAHRTRRVKRSA
jgi:DNA-binding transcriptional MerR regulator